MLYGWGYYKVVPNTGAAGAGSNYTVSVEVHSGSGVDGPGVVYLNNHCVDFPNDIRFTDDNLTTKLVHVFKGMESKGVNWADKVAYFDVCVNDDLSAGVVDIGIFYGKSGEASEASADVGESYLRVATFDNGTRTGLTLNTVATPTVEIPTYTKLFGDTILNVDFGQKLENNPCMAKGGVGQWDEQGVRDLGILLDSQGRIYKETGDLMVAYHYGYTPAGVKQIGKATSNTFGKTWTKLGPIISAFTTTTVSAAIQEDYGAPSVFTDYTAEANGGIANDVLLLPAALALNDAFCIGNNRKYNRVVMDIGTAGAGTYTTILEYYRNDDTWAAATKETDTLGDFKAAGAGKVCKFKLPSDWKAVTVNGVKYWFVRWRVNFVGAGYVQPKADRCYVYTWHNGGTSSMHVNYLASTAPDTSKPYKGLVQGYDYDANRAYLGLYESADGTNFTEFTDADGLYPNPVMPHTMFVDCKTIGVPWYITVGSTYVLIAEGLTYAGGGGDKFRIWGAYATSLDSWTPCDSGNDLIPLGGAGAFDQLQVANPKIVHVGATATDHKYIMAYNGNGSTGKWTVSFATTTTAPASWTNAVWTKHNGRYGTPIVGTGGADLIYGYGGWDAGNVECSAMTRDDIDNGSSQVRLWFQGFNTGGQPQVGLAYLPQRRLLHAHSDAAGDAWVLGHTWSNTDRFYWEFILSDEFADTADGTVSMGLYNAAAVPTPNTLANFAANWRLFIFKYSYAFGGAASGSKWALGKRKAGANAYWTGAGWGAGAYFGTQTGTKAKVKIWYDGTDYWMDIVDLRTGASIVTGAPVRVQPADLDAPPFPAGLAMWVGDAYTDFYYSGVDLDTWVCKKYVSPSPVVGTAGPEIAVPKLASGSNVIQMIEGAFV